MQRPWLEFVFDMPTVLITTTLHTHPYNVHLRSKCMFYSAFQNSQKARLFIVSQFDIFHVLELNNIKIPQRTDENLFL